MWAISRHPDQTVWRMTGTEKQIDKAYDIYKKYKEEDPYNVAGCRAAISNEMCIEEEKLEDNSFIGQAGRLFEVFIKDGKLKSSHRSRGRPVAMQPLLSEFEAKIVYLAAEEAAKAIEPLRTKKEALEDIMDYRYKIIRNNESIKRKYQDLKDAEAIEKTNERIKKAEEDYQVTKNNYKTAKNLLEEVLDEKNVAMGGIEVMLPGLWVEYESNDNNNLIWRY